MKTLYIDCGMGAAGDMLAAALIELMPDRDGLIERLNSLGLPEIEFRARSAEKCGIKCTRLTVMCGGEEEGECLAEHGHHHEHRGLADIERVIFSLNAPEKVKADAAAVFHLLADAESRVHGVPVDEIHFHEVGTLDAIADITAVCLLMHELGAERVAASPVCVGSGSVRCAHGILPVPAPATAQLLLGLPTYGGDIRSELCTPTGAALLRYFVQSFGPQPVMRVEKAGYGGGAKDFERANCVRVLLGETDAKSEEVYELCCELDDMTPEEIGFASERLFAGGALDVYTTPVGMKKNRPGTLLTCICREGARDDILRLMFLHTSTLGIRESVCARYTLERTVETVQTPRGAVRVKRASGWGARREKAEYEDLARIAREAGISLREAAEEARRGGS